MVACLNQLLDRFPGIIERLYSLYPRTTTKREYHDYPNTAVHFLSQFFAILTLFWKTLHLFPVAGSASTVEVCSSIFKIVNCGSLHDVY